MVDRYTLKLLRTMKVVRWLLTYVVAFFVGSFIMMQLHGLSGTFFPESAMESMPQDDPEALKAFIEQLSLGAKLFVSFAHWMGTAFAAAVAMAMAPVSQEQMTHPSRLRVTAPGWAMGVWFLIGGIVNALMIPLPSWLVMLDLMGYFPVALATSFAVVRLRQRLGST